MSALRSRRNVRSHQEHMMNDECPFVKKNVDFFITASSSQGGKGPPSSRAKRGDPGEHRRPTFPRSPRRFAARDDGSAIRLCGVRPSSSTLGANQRLRRAIVDENVGGTGVELCVQCIMLKLAILFHGSYELPKCGGAGRPAAIDRGNVSSAAPQGEARKLVSHYRRTASSTLLSLCRFSFPVERREELFRTRQRALSLARTWPKW